MMKQLTSYRSKPPCNFKKLQNNVNKLVTSHFFEFVCPFCYLISQMFDHSLNLITSAFKEYCGWAWADYSCDNSYICSSASGVSALLVCTALHPQITHRHRSKFSRLVSRLCRYERHKTAVIQSAHRSFLIHTGALSSCWAATLSQHAKSVYTMCLHINLPVFADNPYSRQRVAPVCSVIVSRVHAVAREHVNIPEHKVFQGVHRPQEPRCDKRRVNDT